MERGCVYKGMGKRVIKFLWFLILILACSPAVFGASVNTPTPYSQITPEVQITPAVVHTLEAHVFTVDTYRLWIRNYEGEVVGYLSYGDVIECIPSSSGWCKLEDGTQVFQGCLSEPMGYGCEQR